MALAKLGMAGLVVATVALGACGVESRQPIDGSLPTGIARSVNARDLQAMEPVDQYRVLNRLLGTLYKGMPAETFFDLSAGLSQPRRRDNVDHIEAIRHKLHTAAVDYEAYTDLVEARYSFSGAARARAFPMAMLHELPLTRRYYDQWMAYVLTNTILFSPAAELNSVQREDVATVYNRLVAGIATHTPIVDIVYAHMVSQENWRRFRSPEDNTREMMEIFLMRFRDDEVPLAALACQNWYLTNRFELRKDKPPNTVPQTLLERNDIVSCEEFYRAVVIHPMLIPAIAARLVDHFFANHDAAYKAAFVNEIVRTNPRYFEDIFDTIVFSREYLLNAQRHKTYEETVLGTAGRIDWRAYGSFFNNLNNGGAESLANMNQETMTYKLGRPASVPVDSLSLAYYHKSVRDRLMLRRGTTTGWHPDLVESEAVAALSDEDFIHFAFLSTLMRKATSREVEVLLPLVSAQTRRRDQAMIVFDYTSRAAELYVMDQVEG